MSTEKFFSSMDKHQSGIRQQNGYELFGITVGHPHPDRPAVNRFPAFVAVDDAQTLQSAKLDAAQPCDFEMVHVAPTVNGCQVQLNKGQDSFQMEQSCVEQHRSNAAAKRLDGGMAQGSPTTVRR